MSPRVSPLRIAIVSSGIPQYEVAEKVGIHRTTLSHIIHGGERAKPEVREALARVLNTTVEALWPEDEDVAA